MEKVERKPNTIYTLSLSYGKDSLACLGAIEKLGLPLDRIVHAEVWATQEISADLPPMVEFKAKADEIILKRYGIKVEHVSAINKNGGGVLTYEDMLYQRMSRGQFEGTYRGFPLTKAGWCGKLKTDKIDLRRYLLSTVETTWGGVHHTYGFPMRQGQWCNSMLKMEALNRAKHLRICEQVESVLHRGTQENPTQESFLQALERRAV